MSIEIKIARFAVIPAGFSVWRWLVALVLASAGSTAEGGFSLSSIIEADALNLNPPPYNSFDQVTLNSVSNSTNSALSFNQSYSFAGQVAGTPNTMGYSVAASAQSDYGILKASFDTSITNAFSDPSNPAYNPTTQTGVPAGLGGQSNASFSDRLNLTGGPGLASIRLVVQMDGQLSQSGSAYPYSAGYAALWQSYMGQYGTYYGIIPGARVNTDPGGAFNSTIVTDSFAVTSGQANIYLLLQADTSWEINSPEGQLLANGSSVSSSINYSDTARVVGVEGFDANGNRVALSSVVGDSGTIYSSISTVPEPGSATLLALGVISTVFGLRMRKRGLRPVEARSDQSPGESGANP